MERRSGGVPDTRSGPAAAVMLASFRIAALAICIVQAADGLAEPDWQLVAGTTVAVLCTSVVVGVPGRRRATRVTWVPIAAELAVYSAVVIATDQWASPLTVMLAPASIHAGLLLGSRVAVLAALSCAIVVTAFHLCVTGTGDDDVRDSALWSAALAVIALSGGLTRRASQESARQQRLAFDRISQLAEANALLYSLQRVAQTMPSSLDLAEVLDSTVARAAAMIPCDSVAVLLVRETDRNVDVVRARGVELPASLAPADLPQVIRRAMEGSRTVRVDALDTTTTPGLSADATSGLYGPLHARGALVGVVAVERRAPGPFSAQDAEILQGLTEPFGIAIDNARLFRHLRRAGADEERARIARDLHDHVGSSLAMLGFEVDGALAIASRGDDASPALRHLRQQLTTVLAEVRETLYDLRTDVTDARDLVGTLDEFLQRVRARSGLDVRFEHSQLVRPPIMHEREMWQIAREAITNAERHAAAAQLSVKWSFDGTAALLEVRDDGVGMADATPRADAYGMLGMRERAASIGAELAVSPASPTGTLVRVTVDKVGSDGGPEGGTTWR